MKLSALIAALFALSLTACGQKAEAPAAPAVVVAPAVEVAVSAVAAASAPAAAPADSAAPAKK